MPSERTPSDKDDPAQSQRFIDMAREVDAEEHDAAFVRLLNGVITTNLPPPKKGGRKK